MFKKPPANIKSFSPLRSSDRRRFQNEAYDAYPELKEICTQEGASPLMPESLQSAKFVTHSGVHGVVYVAANKPLWLKLENIKPIPTVYTMWQHPNVLPKLYTWGPVIRKLMEGADLMIPGLVFGPDGSIPDLEKDALVAITVKGYPYPLAVGTMAIPSKDIRVRSGMKGKAVHVIHVYQDALWAMGDKSDPPEMKEMSDDEYEDDEGLESNDAEPTASEVSAPAQESNVTNDSEEEEQENKQQTLSTSEVDDILQRALFYALLFKLTPENANTELPISASLFYSSYILPSRPLGISPDIDVKKSSWKKLAKFFKTMEKQKIIKLKEQRGELIVTSVNWTHPGFQGLHRYKTIESSEHGASGNDTAHKQAENSDDTSQVKGTAEILDLYQPVGNSVVAFFENAGQNKNEKYTSAQIRQVISDYVKKNELADPRNQKMVKIDAYLCSAVLKKAEYHSVNYLTREELLQRLLTQMQPYHLLTLPGKDPVLRKGEAKPITVTQEIRQGRKTVTKVVGVEKFELDVNELCKDLTKLCASSATHNPLPGSSPKQPVYEIMVQGPQIKHVVDLLLRRGVPKRMVVLDDKTAKKSKGKK